MSSFVGVVVPARDEEDSVEACLHAIGRAARHLGVSARTLHTVVVADDCSDRTAEWASRCGAEVIEVSHSSVGHARSVGLERLCQLANGLDPKDVWLATTDADTVVGPSWLARQLDWRARGFDAVAGTVTVGNWSEQPAGARVAFEAHQRNLGTGLGHGHVHGANLGFTAAAYRAAGSMPQIALAEDHALWDALTSAGARTVSAPDIAVVTSARRQARAPGGFSDLLRRLGDAPQTGFLRSERSS